MTAVFIKSIEAISEELVVLWVSLSSNTSVVLFVDLLPVPLEPAITTFVKLPICIVLKLTIKIANSLGCKMSFKTHLFLLLTTECFQSPLSTNESYTSPSYWSSIINTSSNAHSPTL